MYPIIDVPGTGITMRSPMLMVVMATVIAAWLGYRWAVRHGGLEPRKVGWVLIAVGLSTFVCGRLHFVVAQWELFEARPWLALTLRSPSLHAPGAVVGAVLGGALVLRILRLSPGRFIDALAPAAGVGIAMARIGCFLHGCCFGTACTYPWCVAFPGAAAVLRAQVSAGPLPGGVPPTAHPLQLYFAATALAITALLLWLRPRKRYEGQLGVIFLVLFATSSAGLELLRADRALGVYWGPAPQLVCATGAMSVAALGLLAVVEYRHRTRSRSHRRVGQQAAELHS